MSNGREMFLDYARTELYVVLCVTVYHMKETGWEKISQDDVGILHYQYLAQK